MRSLATSDFLQVTGRRLVLTGMVQGLGVRPAIARFAVECGIVGRVCNRLYGVEILVEGAAGRVARFERELPSRLPGVSRLTTLNGSDVAPVGFSDFCIQEDDSNGPLECEIPRDMAICPECLQEIAEPTNRRRGYPWTSCTRCGPRFSILKALPYERRRTTMHAFSFCVDCLREFEGLMDRRFHAQTNACAVCGPHVWLTEASRTISRGAAAVMQAATALRKGAIIALRGLGGYQLLCDATSQIAVDRLRARKKRPSKPFALLVKGVAAAKELADMHHGELKLLTSLENPIVLVQKRRDTRIAPNIAPGLQRLGLMLPGSGLHWLLSTQVNGPLVATSGNLEGEPLATDIEIAEQQLGVTADLFLHHDRDIVNPVDDSVVQCVGARSMLLRCGRGYAPLPLLLPPTARSILATGGDQKSAWALSNGVQSMLGQYVGDLEHLAGRDRFLEVGKNLISLAGAKPELLVHDLHPDFFTSRWAARQKLPHQGVQHHHAHVVAGMVEAGWLNRTVLGIAFDGTGFGSDGVVWGGEFLISTASQFQRVGWLRPFRLPGGALAIHEPWRIWIALTEQVERELPRPHALHVFDREQGEIDLVRKLASHAHLSLETTSAGRLFDGIAAFILGRESAEYDGHFPVLLEAMCDFSESGQYHADLSPGRPVIVDWRPLVRDLICDDKSAPGARAMRFHRGIAAAIVQAANRFADLPVILTGGVFQNRILAELVTEELARNGREVWLPANIPLNDGGLAAGQLAIAIARDQSTAPGRTSEVAVGQNGRC